jgi:prepilin-type N-terminal cleavage/methylation domain-containing protein
MQIKNNKSGFTLIELLISITIFAVVMALVTGSFTNILRGYQQKNIERHVFEEARFIMEKIVKEIRNGAIDYAYYNTHAGTISEDADINYFDYYNLDAGELIVGDNELEPVQDILAVVKQDGSSRSMFWASGYDHTSEDLGSSLGDSLAHDPIEFEDPDIPINKNKSVLFKRMIYWAPGNPLNNILEEAYPSGDFEAENFSLPYALPADEIFSMKTVPGVDPDENWAWFNYPEFVDSNYQSSDHMKAGVEGEGWRPISSSNVNIVDLKFIITPTQDPYKFWDVIDSNNPNAIQDMQTQPKVTILLTIEPIAIDAKIFNKKRVPRISLQRTISARVYDQIYYQGWPKKD